MESIVIMVFLTMDHQQAFQLREEIRQLRGTVKAFGIYFVVLTLLPIAWAIFWAAAIGSFLGGFTDSVGKTVEKASTAIPSEYYKHQSEYSKRQVDDLRNQVSELQQRLAEQITQEARNPRPRNNPTMTR